MNYMNNDQLLPAYNIQSGVCDEYIAQYAVCPYASDMDCFQLLHTAPIKGNQYGRTEELYQSEDCQEHTERCHKSQSNRTIRLHKELTEFCAEGEQKASF